MPSPPTVMPPLALFVDSAPLQCCCYSWPISYRLCSPKSQVSVLHTTPDFPTVSSNASVAGTKNSRMSSGFIQPKPGTLDSPCTMKDLFAVDTEDTALTRKTVRCANGMQQR